MSIPLSRPAVPRRRRSLLARAGAGGWFVSPPLLLVIGFFVLFPVAKVVLVSLQDPATRSLFSLQAYQQILTSPLFAQVVLNTAIVVAGAVAIALAIGTLLAWSINRTDLPMARYLDVVPLIPLLLPAMVEAIGWTALLSPRTGYVNVLLRWLAASDAATGPITIFSLGGVMMVIGFSLIPYVYALLSAAFQSYNPALDEASRVMGSSIWRTLWRVSLPVVRPAILGSIFLGTVVAIAQFAIPAILGTPARIQVLSTLIYQYSHGYPPQYEAGAAISTLLGVVAMIGQVATILVLRRGGHATVSGKGMSGHRLPLGRWRPVVLGLIFLYLVVVVVLPLSATFLLSVSNYWSIESLDPSRWTFANYHLILFEHPHTWTAIRNSFSLAIVGATLGVMIGALMAYIIVQERFVGHRLIALVAMVPLVIPGIVYGVGVLHAFIAPPLVLYGTLGIFLVGYVGHFLPHAVRATDVSLRQIGTELEEASRVFGGGWGRTALRVTLPLIRPGMVAGWSLLAILMLRELPLSALVYTPRTNVIAVMLYNLWENGSLPEVAAFSIVLVVISLAMVIVIRLLSNRARERW